MSRHIVKVFNQTVAEDDTLYHLGDWSFGGLANVWNFRKQLRCKNIHLIYGNHDNHIKNNKELPNVFMTYREEQAQYTDGTWSRDIERIPNGLSDLIGDPAYAKELFTSTNDVLTVKHGSHAFFLSHYSHQIWLGSHKSIIHLFGHSHDSIKGIGKSMDVGIDVAKRLLGEYKPFSIEEIINIMDKKEVVFLDKHNPKTNI